MNKLVVYYITVLSGILGISNHTSNNTLQISNVSDTGACDLCKGIVYIVRDELKVSNDSINEVEAIMRQVCNHTHPEVKRRECNTIIDEINEIKNLIIGGLEPRQICYKIGFC